MNVKTGAYILTHIPTGRFYIGSSANLTRRHYTHKYDLTSGKHANRKLQEVFTNWSDIRIDLFETSTVEEARQREQILLNRYYGNHLCCNQSSSVYDPTAGVITPEIRRSAISSAIKSVTGVSKSNEHRLKLSEANSGKVRSSSTKEAISDSKSRSVRINGKTYKSVSAAAQELGINPWTLRSRIASNSEKHKDYSYV